MTIGESQAGPSRPPARRIRRARLATVVAAGLAAAALAPLGGGPASAAPAQVAPLGIAAGGILPYASQAERDAYLSAAHDLGARWLRFDMTWNDIQRTNSTNYDWARYDKVVADAQRHGLKVVGLIGYAPQWAQHASCAGNNRCKPRDAEEYGRFAGAVAEHFGTRGVHHWEIWNEPNVPQFFAPAPDPALYAAMLRSAHRHIHAADPAGRVIIAGAAPAASEGGSYSPIDFLKQLYAAGAGDSFDILGTHPYCFAGSFDCPKQTEIWNAWSQMARTKVSLRSVLAAHGDGGTPIWATEFGAPTNGSQATTEAHQARMLVDALKLFPSEPATGPLFVYSLRDRGTNPGDREDWFGVLRADGTRKPAFAEVQALLRASTQAEPGDGAAGNTSPGLPTGPPTVTPRPVVPPLVPPVSTSAPAVRRPAVTTGQVPRARGKAKKKPGWFTRLVDSLN